MPVGAGCVFGLLNLNPAVTRGACTKMKAHPVGELRLLGKPGRLNELCFCAALNCRF